MKANGIKTIWGLAKSPELNLNDDMLYDIVYRLTKKDSLKALTQKQIDMVCKELFNLKDNAKGSKKGKRTDVGGRRVTKFQRQ